MENSIYLFETFSYITPSLFIIIIIISNALSGDLSCFNPQAPPPHLFAMKQHPETNYFQNSGFINNQNLNN